MTAIDTPPPAAVKDLPTSERAQARRQQVLDAASDCFRRKGFHGASMAEIAKLAGMSPGHIYNLFTNKEDIIGAIVERNQIKLSEIVQTMKSSDDVHAAMIEEVGSGVRDVTEPAMAALGLEVLAEAGRNPKVAEIVQAADAQGRVMLKDLMCRAWQTSAAGRIPDDADARVEVLAAIFDGLTARSVYNPTLDHAAVTRVVQRVIQTLLKND